MSQGERERKIETRREGRREWGRERLLDIGQGDRDRKKDIDNVPTLNEEIIDWKGVGGKGVREKRVRMKGVRGKEVGGERVGGKGNGNRREDDNKERNEKE